MSSPVDVRQIADHIRNANGNVTFIIGAGASRSAEIPLASELVEKIAKEYGHCLKGIPESERSNYGRVMGQLVPAERERLIKPLLENAKVNWGHIALATLLRQRLVQRVLTFNFDLILEKAASMLGLHLPVYDFGVAPSGDVNRIVKPSIVHLHGQSHGMKLLHSDAETQVHCNAIRPLLADVLRNSLTVVVGYSGEADLALDVMSGEYNSYNRLFWLGYDEFPKEHLGRLLEKPFAKYIGRCDFDRVMIDLAKAFDIWPPTVVAEPMRHVLSVLEPATKYPVGKDDNFDLLVETRRRLEEFSVLWLSAKTPDQRAYDSALGLETDIGEGTEKDQERLSEGARTALAWASLAEGVKLGHAGRVAVAEEALAKYREAQKLFAYAAKLKSDMHEAFYNWGLALSDEAEYLTGNLALEKLRDASLKFEQAIAIDPVKEEAFYSWSTALIIESTYLSGDERLKILDLAEGKLEKYRKITGHISYNQCCLHALRGEAEKAVAALVACHADGRLPDPAHLDSDTDLDSIRDDPAYQTFRASLEPPKGAA